jgi:hypothetical protein
VTAPSVHIVLELEAAPRVYCDYLHDGEDARMVDWLAGHDEYRELIDRALEVAERERAA